MAAAAPQTSADLSAAAEQVEIAGITYKIGVHGLVFYWYQGEWIRSAKDAYEIRAELARLAKRRKAQAAKAEAAEAQSRTHVEKPKGKKKPKSLARDRVLKTLRDSDEPLTLEEVAFLSNTSNPSARRVVGELAKDGLITQGPRRMVKSANWPVQTWKADKRFKGVL